MGNSPAGLARALQNISCSGKKWTDRPRWTGLEDTAMKTAWLSCSVVGGGQGRARLDGRAREAGTAGAEERCCSVRVLSCFSRV